MLKTHLRRVLPLVALATLLVPLLLMGKAQASQPLASEEQFGEYVVRSSAFNSTFLLPKVASSYGLERSTNRALLNVSIMTKGKAVAADLQIVAANLLGQKTQLTPKLIDEGEAKYYLASFKITNDELLHFTIKVTPKGSKLSHTVKFSQKFYQD